MKPNEKEVLFLQLLAQMQPSLFRLGFSFVDNADDNRDLQQEIAIQLWNAMEKFEGRSSWKTFVYRIAVNTAIKFKINLTRHKILRQHNENLQTSIQHHADENLLQLRYFLAKLPEADRMLIGLWLEGLSYAEIAETTGLTQAHVGVKIQRIKEKIKKQIEDEDNRFGRPEKRYE